MEVNANKSKALKIVLNILIGIVIAIILLVAVSVIFSKNKGYFSVFGVAPYAVRSDSMEGGREPKDGKPGSFNKGDLIFVKELSDEEKSNLEIGDVITFFQFRDGKYELNTHRVVRKTAGEVETQGDKAKNNEYESTSFTHVVGVYTGSRIPVVGSVILFMQSPTGFLLTVVLPSVLVVIYCAFIVIRNYSRYQTEKNQVYRDGIVSEVEQVRLAEQKMAQMQQQIEELKRLAEQNEKNGSSDKNEPANKNN